MITTQQIEAVKQSIKRVAQRFWQLPKFRISIPVDDPEERRQGRVRCQWVVTTEKQDDLLAKFGVKDESELIKTISAEMRAEVDDAIMRERGWTEAQRRVAFGHPDPLPTGTYRVTQRWCNTDEFHLIPGDEPLEAERFVYELKGPEGPYRLTIAVEPNHPLAQNELDLLAFTVTEHPEQKIKRWVRPVTPRETLDFLVGDELSSGDAPTIHESS